MTSRIVPLIAMVAVSYLHAEGPTGAPTVPAQQTPASQFNKPLHDELAQMVAPDQAARKKPAGQMTKEDFEEMHRIDVLHEMRMKEIIAKFGWPGRSLVGEDGSQNAWLLVQHCSLEFEELCLPLLERAVAQGDASKMNYAYLLDRVRMYQGRPQVYGTQFRNEQLVPVENPEQVDERRKSVGLGPLAEYVELMRKLNGRPNSKPEPTPLR